MRLRRTSVYGLSAILYLARREEPGPATVKQISDATQIPVEYLRKLLSRLMHGRLIRSVRGRRGGFLLAQKPADVSLLMVVEAIEGPIDETSIFDDDLLDHHDASVADSLRGWRRIASDSMRELLERSSAADLIADDADDPVIGRLGTDA